MKVCVSRNTIERVVFTKVVLADYLDYGWPTWQPPNGLLAVGRILLVEKGCESSDQIDGGDSFLDY